MIRNLELFLLGRIKAAIGIPDNRNLKSVSDFNSKWADRLALLILIGLILDIVAVFVKDTLWHPVLAVGANAMIFSGVWGELHFAKRARTADDSRVAEAEKSVAEANVRAAEAGRRAAEANERAAEANKKAEEEKTARLKLTAQLTARNLTDETCNRIAEALKGKIGKLTVLRITDTEAGFLAMELLTAFRMAGIDTSEIILPMPSDGYGYPAGIYVLGEPNNERHWGEVRLLAAVLSELNLGPAIPAQGLLYGPTGGVRFPEDIPFSPQCTSASNGQ